MRRKVPQKCGVIPLNDCAPQSPSKECRKVPKMCGVIPLNGCAPQSPSRERRKVLTMRRKVPKKSGVIPFKLFCGIPLNGYAPQSPSKEWRYSVKWLCAAKSLRCAVNPSDVMNPAVIQQSPRKSRMPSEDVKINLTSHF